MPNVSNNSTSFQEVEYNSTSAEDDDFACYLMNNQDVSLSYRLYLLSTILSVAMGLVGNTLSVLVFSSKSMLRFSSNVYLLMLALSDSVFLVSVFLSKILTTLRCLYFFTWRFDVVNRSSVICKVLQYCIDLFSDYSTCLILGFTVERYAAAYLPVQFKRTCTDRRAKFVCAVTFVVIALFIAPYHALFMGRYRDYDVCTVLVDHEEEFTVLYFVEVVVFRIVPVIAIALLNVFIIAKVTRITRQRTQIIASLGREEDRKTGTTERTKSIDHHHHHHQRKKRRESSRFGRFRRESASTKSFGLKSRSVALENNEHPKDFDPEEQKSGNPVPSGHRKPDPDFVVQRQEIQTPDSPRKRPDGSGLPSSRPDFRQDDHLEMVRISQQERSAADDKNVIDDVTKSSSTCYHCNLLCWRHVIPGGRKNRNESERNRKKKNRNKNAARDDRSLQMTVTLILVSTIYVIVFLPVLVHFLLWKLERSGVIAVSPVAMQIAQNYTRTLYVAGFAVNFFLYTISGRTFREQLRTVLCRRTRDTPTGNRCRPEV